MTHTSTITSKGQVTIPAEIRREFGFNPGQLVTFRVEEGNVLIEPPPRLEEVRARLQSEMKRKGTWGIPYTSGDGWKAAVREKYGPES
ncbi:MAG: AbrB/MazE/SpoVT family DNA-binding domain-containing protein [Propionibacteriaceae bacterium]|jgi:AbrB family looped-hinge helix DNA binding protein|nr:AbrB/MazE/SpoVT family DNA-binding domain-containing protein [Propionibacteriaceae bacterium]